MNCTTTLLVHNCEVNVPPPSWLLTLSNNKHQTMPRVMVTKKEKTACKYWILTAAQEHHRDFVSQYLIHWIDLANIYLFIMHTVAIHQLDPKCCIHCGGKITLNNKVFLIYLYRMTVFNHCTFWIEFLPNVTLKKPKPDHKVKISTFQKLLKKPCKEFKSRMACSKMNIWVRWSQRFGQIMWVEKWK